MHCTSSRNGVFSPEIPLLDTQRDAFLAAILARNMTKNAGVKRSCPFSSRQSHRPETDLRSLQQDVEELETRLAAARRRRNAPTKKQVNANRLRNLLQACRMQAQQRVNVDANMGFVPGVPSTCCLEYEPSVDGPLFKKMQQNLKEQYKELAQVFRDAGLRENTTDMNDGHVVSGGDQSTFVRFTTAKIAPFGLDTINSAMWSGAKKNSVLNMDAIDGADSNTIYLKRECMLQCDSLGGQGIPVLLRGVCRRYVEPERIVLLWEGTGDWPKEYLLSNPSSVPIRERGYCVIQRFNNGSRSAPLSLLQTCINMTPGLSAEIDMDEPECRKMLTDVVIPSYRKILDARDQILENAIMDEMIHSKLRASRV